MDQFSFLVAVGFALITKREKKKEKKTQLPYKANGLNKERCQRYFYQKVPIRPNRNHNPAPQDKIKLNSPRK